MKPAKILKMSIPSVMKAVIPEAGACAVVERPVPAPAAGQVLLKIHATALNRADTLQRGGKYPPPPGESDILGLECVGEVVSEGGQKFQAGARVMSLLASGGYAEYVAVDER